MTSTIKYPQGKNPNSLANLKRGGFKSEQDQLDCSKKGVEGKKSKKALRETLQKVLEEKSQFDFTFGNTIMQGCTMTLMEAVVRAFVEGCINNPTPQKIDSICKLLGEDETTIVVDAPQGRYRSNFDDIDLPKELKVNLAMAIMEANNYADTHKDEVK